MAWGSPGLAIAAQRSSAGSWVAWLEGVQGELISPTGQRTFMPSVSRGSSPLCSAEMSDLFLSPTGDKSLPR